ncbi:MAG: rhomboid family intramembrane serine protease [Candidatus Nezhaarchaeota archaeon]|nr:rhomboid family intramembrane serine protease [Candidatus Nezhaarchaeota archaeon]MCX8142404.1 rhomboid family intramembrane serine protease [Candidatus Nezhaarchaeota archaeon]MDW8050623.1 rhomboid family intramembrane serine protease [Nitrososphaerota archaeon]
MSRSRRIPLMTLSLIIVNVVVYVLTSYEGALLNISNYWVVLGGFIPSLLASSTHVYRIFSSMFLHADLFHILFNMYFLYLFGRAIEDALGRLRFLALYIISGIMASLFHTVFSFLGGISAYTIPAIGASGAISGILGAYLILFPGTTLIMGWLFFIFPVFMRLKAVYYLIFWFAAQVIYGYAKIGGGIAFFAHAGGFVAGMALLPLIVSREVLARLRLAWRQAALPSTIYVHAPRTAGLSLATKVIISILLVSLLIGAAYAITGLPVKGDIKSMMISYAYNGKPYMDYLGFQVPNVEDQLTRISLDETRILLNRLYAADLLYDKAKANREVYVNDWSGRLLVRIGGQLVPVELLIISFRGYYDGDGFLSSCRGELKTQVILIDARGIRVSDYMVHYDFEATSQTVKLEVITHVPALLSLATTAFALAVILIKDKELTIVGEREELS